MFALSDLYRLAQILDEAQPCEPHGRVGLRVGAAGEVWCEACHQARPRPVGLGARVKA